MLADTPQKKRSVKPRPFAEPPRRGTIEQHKADAPFRERGPSTASMVQESKDSGSRVSAKQELDAHASIKLSLPYGSVLLLHWFKCEWQIVTPHRGLLYATPLVSFYSQFLPNLQSIA